VLEDHPRFNAGRGSVLTSAGTIEMDASIMEGEALRAGAVGYVLKSEAAHGLLGAIEIAERGGSPLSPQIARRLVATFEDVESGFEPLSGREREILRCFAAGASYEGAADSLGISVDTVRTHVRRLYGKLRVRSRSEALLAAVRRGILPGRS